MSIARNVICCRRLTGLFPSDTPGCDRSAWLDEAAQLELYTVADRQPMQLDQGRRDMVGATQATSQAAAFWTRCSGCIVDVGSPANTLLQ